VTTDQLSLVIYSMKEQDCRYARAKGNADSLETSIVVVIGKVQRRCENGW
jgi:hypothetical protein